MLRNVSSRFHRDLIESFSESIDFDTILFGDMFYSDEFCVLVEDWLTLLAKNGCNFRVLIGDPGRTFWSDNSLQKKCRKIWETELSESVTFEYPGFHTGSVYQAFEKDFL